MERLLTKKDVAERLQVCLHKAGDYMREMRCVVLPGDRSKRVTEDELARWIRSRTQGAATPARKQQAAGLPRKRNGKLVAYEEWRRQA